MAFWTCDRQQSSQHNLTNSCILIFVGTISRRRKITPFRKHHKSKKKKSMRPTGFEPVRETPDF